MGSKKSAANDAAAFYEKRRDAMLSQKAVSEKKMFGTTALCVGGKVFLFPWKENLVFKLPEERVQQIIAAKKGEYFDPGHGRTSKTWVAVYPSARRQWSKLMDDARAFVDKG